MGIFQRLKGKSATPAPVTDKKATAKKPAEAKKADAKPAEEHKVIAPKIKAAKFAYLLVSPRVSEKAAILASRGTYVFNVPTSANKVEVRKAVEAFYDVKVTDVRTIRGPGKIVRRGRTSGQRPNWKKALVTLKAGQKIDLYEGV